MVVLLMLPLLILLQAQTPERPNDAIHSIPPPSTQRYDEGPLRVEVVALMEARMKNLDPQPGTPRDSEMRIQFRVQGVGVDKIVRFGNIILEEVVDDTGRALLRPDQYTESDRTALRPMAAPPERLREAGLLMMGRTEAASRNARTLKTLRGTVRIVLAERAPEQVTIDSIVTKVGPLEDTRLAAAGVQLRVLPADELETAPTAPNKAFLLQYVAGRSAVKGATFYDASLRQIRARESETRTRSGETVFQYLIDEKLWSPDTQLVLEVYPQVEEKSIAIDLTDFELP
jgi:hypothetical protein